MGPSSSQRHNFRSDGPTPSPLLGRIPLRLVRFWKRRLPGLKFGGVAGALLGVLIRKKAFQKRAEERNLEAQSGP